MTAVDILHHENPPTWVGFEPTIFASEVQRQTNYATRSASSSQTLFPVFEAILTTTASIMCHKSGMPAGSRVILAENQYFKVRPTDQESKEGDDVEFQCHIGNRGGDVQWSKDGFLLARGYIHFYLKQPDSIHSAKSKSLPTSGREEHPKPRLPNPIVATNSLHATPQNVNSNYNHVPDHRLSDMGLSISAYAQK
ncbi:hypothetical protein TNCV_4927301 [Trichonephila clavipes]|nr:hypothetical protein TNCV_4927301 [Trichonephila clavipes]